ncbi:MAG: excinuclease ABC subunit C [Polyangiales bacterium]|jgi:excinuclease ABC subunit C
MEVSEKIQQKLDTLPASPGVYVFHGCSSATKALEVLYVGKASSLRSRVRSYFQDGSSDVRAFVARLAFELVDIETFVTATEKEAALLENQIIKERQPRYNVKLRDDKEFLSLRLAPKGAWPRLEVVRRPRADGARYFGPYHSATAARQTLRLVNRHFQLRTCTDAELRSRSRPCLQFQIRRCPGPCVMDVDKERYAQQVSDVGLFLSGRHDELVEKLQSQMLEASDALEFEQAGVHRDQLRAVTRARETQRVASVSMRDQDVFGLFRQADQAEIAVLQVRAGRLVGVRTFDLRRVALPDDELIASFIVEWYERAPVPDEVLLPHPIEAMDGLASALSDRQRSRETRGQVQVAAPTRGKRNKLLDMARDNAEHAFHEKRRAQENILTRLQEVQKRLRLKSLPHRIECVDISHTGGDDTVAAVVALKDGAPDKERYRTYHVKRVSGGDDYGAMYEVLSRRFRRGRDGNEGWDLPDLFVVDGGKGQLGVALAALRDLGMPNEAMPVVALAKEKENLAGERRVDRVYLPGQKNPIPVHSTPALSMLCLARDEAHRVSNGLRTKVGKRRRLTSGLDSVKGVGPKTRTKLLSTLGSLEAVLESTEAELISAGATKRQAAAILQQLSPASPNPKLDSTHVVDRGIDEGVVDEETVSVETDLAVENAFREVLEDATNAT